MFNGNLLRDAFISAANNIANNKKSVDDLNVFPVPDGDTGTNMSLTLANAARELDRVDNQSVGSVSATIASALLRGSRGNSGVITSLIFRGMAKGFKDAAEITPENLADAFRLGAETAYKAVKKPTEGTILTVIRVASENAAQALKNGADVLGVFDEALRGAEEALAQTPELLPVLKKAGVVDAGGRGLVYILEGISAVLHGGNIIAAENNITEESENDSGRSAAGEVDAEITFTYCTEFIVNRAASSSKEPADLRTFLGNIGDCVVVVDDDEIIKVHVHTDHPGKALEEALTYGSLVKLKIENMRDQHEKAKHDAEEKSAKPAKSLDNNKPITPAAPVKPVGFVSVCAGEGLTNLFKELGADVIVSGGQTMNPSTDDILRAVESTPAETVFVLPNNKNIIMAAELAIPLSTKKVIVLHTRTVPQGVTAMLNFLPESSDDENAINMSNAFEAISTGQITFAARNSNYDGHKIKEGDLLAIDNGKISFTEADLEKCTVRLVKQMLKRDSAAVTLYYGADVSEPIAEKINSVLNEKFGDKVEITLINGGQPVYYFILSVE